MRQAIAANRQNEFQYRDGTSPPKRITRGTK